MGDRAGGKRGRHKMWPRCNEIELRVAKCVEESRLHATSLRLQQHEQEAARQTVAH